MTEGVFIALDVGATGIKTVTADVKGDGLEIRNVKSAATLPKNLNGCSYVDIERIIEELSGAVRELEGENILSAGIDTFGNGYGFLDSRGELIAPPYDYRDGRVGSILEKVHAHYTDRRLYDLVGNFPFRSRALFHLFEDVLENSENIRSGRVMLPLPNLIEYLLTGNVLSERTIASVLYMLDERGEDWNIEVFRELGIPTETLIPVTEPGRWAGYITRHVPQDVAERKIPMINVIGHDTESALITVPSMDEHHIFVCLGTSFIFGTRLDHPVVTEASYAGRFKNMRGAFGKYSLCKDFPGFWLLEQCMDEWRKDHKDLTYDDVSRAAQSISDNGTWLNINDESFRIYGNISDKIDAYCRRTSQKKPEGMASLAACLYESYCLFLRQNTESLKEITGNELFVLDAFNGGVRNSVLMQMLADCLQIEVRTHSVYASACGNLLMQYGVHKGVRRAQELGEAASSLSKPKSYFPRKEQKAWWDRKFDQYLLMLEKAQA